MQWIAQFFGPPRTVFAVGCFCFGYCQFAIQLTNFCSNTMHLSQELLYSQAAGW